MKSRVSAEVTTVNCCKLYFVVHYIIYCNVCLCSQANTHFCCLDFLWFFCFCHLIHLYQHVYSCGVVVWSSTDWLESQVFSSFTDTQLPLNMDPVIMLFSEPPTLSNMLLCCGLMLKLRKQNTSEDWSTQTLVRLAGRALTQLLQPPGVLCKTLQVLQAWIVGCSDILVHRKIFLVPSRNSWLGSTHRSVWVSQGHSELSLSPPVLYLALLTCWKVNLLPILRSWGLLIMFSFNILL